MLKEFIEKIVALAPAPTFVEAKGKPNFYLLPQPDGSWQRLDYDQEEKAPKVPVALAIHTLEGLADYIGSNIDSRATKLADSEASGKPAHDVWGRHMLHVVSETEVKLISATHPYHQTREEVVVARFESLFGNTKFQFGTFMPMETAMIGLLSLFEDTPERADLMKILGNVKSNKVITATDDGVTQEVEVRFGAAFSERAALHGDVQLQPYRTFREVAQPASAFRVRLRDGAEGQLPSVAIYETDGGAWKLDAIRNIGEWLAENVEAEITIIA